MDITPLFKASVMTVKLQRKSELQALDKNRILPKSATATASKRDEFARQAKDVCIKISTLRNVLLENRTAYMRIGQHLKNAAHMTDEQRDLIDRESEKFVTYYTQHLAQMRTDWKGSKRKPQERAHIEAVLDLLVNYLHSVQQIYLDQKKYRIQHELETYRLLKLASDKKKIPVRPAGESTRKLLRKHHSADSDDSSLHSSTNNYSSEVESDMDLNDGWQMDKSKKASELRHRFSRANKTNLNAQSSTDQTKSTNDEHELKLKSSKVALDEDIQKSQQLVDEEETSHALSPDDIQMFEEENVQLYHELQGLSEEVEQIERNVVDIAQLQDIFTEKVSLQQHNIERIISAVVGATENVKDANEQIKQATQRNAGLRVWSLFFLLVMSFSLLFLDWYYD